MVAAKFTLFTCIVVSAMPAARAVSIDSDAGTGDDLTLAKTWNATAEQYMNQGAYEDARRFYLRSLPVLEKTLGPEHPATITTLGNLCVASGRMTAYLDAKPVCARALAVREKVFGPNHPDVARSLSDLGLLYANEGDLGRAESLLRRALRIDSAIADSPDMPSLLNNLGFLYVQKRKYGQAADLFGRAIAATEKSCGPEDPKLADMLTNAATVDLTNHQYRAAEELFRRALRIAERSVGPDQVSSVRALVGLARAEAALGKSSEAEASFGRAQSVVARNRQAYSELRGAIEAARLGLTRRGI